MTRAQILRKKTGIVLAIIGIVLSLLPAVRMADGSKLFIFQIIGNDIFFAKNIATQAELGAFLTGILLCVITIYGLLVHILNLFLWTRKSEKTYFGVMALSWGSFFLLIGGAVAVCIGSVDDVTLVAIWPFTIWQTLRILVTFAEGIMKLHGEELIDVFFPEK